MPWVQEWRVDVRGGEESDADTKQVVLDTTLLTFIRRDAILRVRSRHRSKGSRA